MTSQKYIQSLIDDIDGILPKAEARLPWSKPGDVAAQRRVLERVRSFLVSEQQNFATDSERPLVPTTPEQRDVVQQIVQVVTQEMDVIRTNLMHPLQKDIETLRQQRDSLVQEIRRLEGTKQRLDSITHQKPDEQEFLSEFSHSLINHCAENLTQQLAQFLASWDVRHATNMESTETLALVPQTQVGSVMHPQERLEQLRQLQEQSDRLLTNLDANQRVIFEALQRNLQGYQDSLSQGLDKMHRLGVQGELLFTALVNRLAQQLGREASTLLQSSLQPSDPTHQTNETAPSQTTPETLLPTNALNVIQSSPSTVVPLIPSLQLSPSLEAQAPIYPLQSVDQLHTEPASTSIAAQAQRPIPEATAMPLVPQESPSLEVRSPTSPDQSGLVAEDSLLENLDADNWEVIEGLEEDFGSLDFETDDSGIETFIQLDIDSEASLPLDEAMMTPSPSDTQAPDFLPDSLNEKLSADTLSPEQTELGEVAGLDELYAGDEQNISTESLSKEIEELYESLFGLGSLTDQGWLDESDLEDVDTHSDLPEQKQAPTDVQMLRDEPFSNTDSVNSLSSQVEDVLFEGLADPAIASPQSQSLDLSGEQLANSLDALFAEDSVADSPVDDLFVEDLVADSPIEEGLAEEAQEVLLWDSQLSKDEIPSNLEGADTIAALTDLFEEMGLNPSEEIGLSPTPPVAEANSLPTTTHKQTEDQSSKTQPQPSLTEDSYIPALPDEDLLLMHELESEPDREILLNQSILQKLSEDLYSFEESKNQNFQRQEEQKLPGDDGTSLPVAPDPDQTNQENLRFPMWEELLAEDWEEFGLNDWSEEASTSPSLESEATTNLSVQGDINQEGATDSTQEEILDNFTDSVSEPGRDRPQVTPTKEPVVETSRVSDLATHGELNMFEDEAFLEMLWDEQIDNTIEEMITSPELVFDLDFFSPEAPDSKSDGTLTPDEETLDESIQGQSSDRTQNTSLSSQNLEDESDFVSQNDLDLDDGTLSLDMNSPQSNPLKPKQPVNPQKKNSDLD